MMGVRRDAGLQLDLTGRECQVDTTTARWEQTFRSTLCMNSLIAIGAASYPRTVPNLPMVSASVCPAL